MFDFEVLAKYIFLSVFKNSVKTVWQPYDF